jgi:hypothetical protein
MSVGVAMLIASTISCAVIAVKTSAPARLIVTVSTAPLSNLKEIGTAAIGVIPVKSNGPAPPMIRSGDGSVLSSFRGMSLANSIPNG